MVHPRTARLFKYGKDLLVQLQEICERYNVLMFLDGGTLLGAVREKDFICDDRDIDTATLCELKDLEKTQQLVYNIKVELREWMGKSKKRADVSFYFYVRAGDYYVTKWRSKRGDVRYMYVTADTFSKFRKINFKGAMFNVPDPPEKRLEQLYEVWDKRVSLMQCVYKKIYMYPQIIWYAKAPRNQKEAELVREFEKYFKGRYCMDFHGRGSKITQQVH